jgi:hypothetical protein
MTPKFHILDWGGQPEPIFDEEPEPRSWLLNYLLADQTTYEAGGQEALVRGAPATRGALAIEGVLRQSPSNLYSSRPGKAFAT